MTNTPKTKIKKRRDLDPAQWRKKMTVNQKLQAEIRRLKNQIALLHGQKIGKYLYINENEGSITVVTNCMQHEVLGFLEHIRLDVMYQLDRAWDPREVVKSESPPR